MLHVRPETGAPLPKKAAFRLRAWGLAGKTVLHEANERGPGTVLQSGHGPLVKGCTRLDIYGLHLSLLRQGTHLIPTFASP